MAGLRTTQSEAILIGAKGGFVSFSVDGVLARSTKGAKSRAMADVDFGKRMGSMLRLGGLVASHMRRRVADRGQMASRPKTSYSRLKPTGGGKVHQYAVAVPYATEANTDPAADTSHAWHQRAGVKFGTFDVTGGMWAGMQVRSVNGGDGVAIDFRGSSVGGTGKAKTYTGKKKNKETGEITEVTKTRSESTRLNIRNQDKAGRVFALFGVNVIQPTAEEDLAMAAAVGRQHHITLQNALGEPPPGVQIVAGDVGLFNKLVHSWVKR